MRVMRFSRAKTFLLAAACLLLLMAPPTSATQLLGIGETLRYQFPLTGPLTEDRLKNATYMVPRYGSFAEGNYNEDAPHTPMRFTNGIGEAQSGAIEKTALQSEGAPSLLQAAVFLTYFDGGNGYLGDIVFILDTPEGRMAYQADIGVYRGIIVEQLAIAGDVATIKYLYAGPGEPTCCPTAKGWASYIVRNGELVKAQ